MAHVTIIAKNITSGPAVDLPIDDLSAPDAKILASGQVELTLYNTVQEIQSDRQLEEYIEDDKVIINDGTSDLSKTESLNYVSTVATTTDPEFRSCTETDGGSGNAGCLLALDGDGKADGRELGTDGTMLEIPAATPMQ